MSERVVDCKVVRAEDRLIYGVIGSRFIEWLQETLPGGLTECSAD